MNDDELDALLKAPAHLDDAGFTEQVVAKLPERRRAPRFAIVFGSASLGTLIAFVASAPRGFVTLLDGVSHANWLAPAIVLASVVVVLTGAALTEATSRA